MCGLSSISQYSALSVVLCPVTVKRESYQCEWLRRQGDCGRGERVSRSPQVCSDKIRVK